jgi:hypothetical protein
MLKLLEFSTLLQPCCKPLFIAFVVDMVTEPIPLELILPEVEVSNG